MPHFYAIILAAGQSTRMGREKSSLPWLDGKFLLPWLAEELANAGWSPVAVVRPERLAFWTPLLPSGCTFANPNPDQGKITSLSTGLHHVPPTGHLLITSVDQPRPPALYRRLRQEAEASTAKIIVPARQGGRGHPVIFSGTLRAELFALDETSCGLRGLLNRYRSETCLLSESDPAEAQWDLNTPSDYEQALKYFKHCIPKS